jgi:NAD(P)-dependent dehydrogenase (short-subunit alcohol dehydrogenase family)
MRNPDRSPELRERAESENLPISIGVMDVDSDDSVRSAIANIHSREGQIDVLVNNAGIDRIGSVEELPFEAFQEAMQTNYFGALRCIKALLPGMRARRSGCIVNVTSIAGRIACSPMAPYTASKFALEALSEALAQEVKAFNIRVAVVQPGIIDTPMARRVEEAPSGSLYPQTVRFANLFEASLENPASPSLVGDKIREIIESGTWQLRHPVGPDAEPFLGWRASMTDEDWVNWGALEDDVWYERVANDFGLNARPKQRRTTGA